MASSLTLKTKSSVSALAAPAVTTMSPLVVVMATVPVLVVNAQVPAKMSIPELVEEVCRDKVPSDFKVIFPFPLAFEVDNSIPPLAALKARATVVSSMAEIVPVPMLASKSPVPLSINILLLFPEVSSFKDPPARSLNSPSPPTPLVEISIPPLVASKAMALMAA